MVKNYRAEKGFAHVIVIVGLVVALMGALGFIFWQNFVADKGEQSNTQETVQTKNESPQEEVKEEKTENTGTIVGSLTYPSEGIPPNLEVHAVNLDTGKEYVTKDHLKGSQYQYGVGYAIEVPVGRYNVYGTFENQPDRKAYYNQVIVCGVTVDCKDTTNVEVIVEAGKETIDATVGDWWSI